MLVPERNPGMRGRRQCSSNMYQHTEWQFIIESPGWVTASAENRSTTDGEKSFSVTLIPSIKAYSTLFGCFPVTMGCELWNHDCGENRLQAAMKLLTVWLCTKPTEWLSVFPSEWLTDLLSAANDIKTAIKPSYSGRQCFSFRLSGQKALGMRSCAPDTSCIFNQSISAVSTSLSPPPSISSFFFSSLSLSPSAPCSSVTVIVSWPLCLSPFLLERLQFINLSHLSHLPLSDLSLHLEPRYRSPPSLLSFLCFHPLALCFSLLQTPFMFSPSSPTVLMLSFIISLKTGAVNVLPFWLTLEIICPG